MYCRFVAKLPESGDLCGNITEFGVAERSTATPDEVILPYGSPDKGCSVFISYCLIILSFSAKVYEINMYLLLYLSFKIKV